jgi:DNA topoisomerase IB
LNVTAVNSSSIKAYWQDGGNATDFRIYVEAINKTYNISKYASCLNSSECNLVIKDMSAGTNYSIKVFALAYGTENGESCSLSGNASKSSHHVHRQSVCTINYNFLLIYLEIF